MLKKMIYVTLIFILAAGIFIGCENDSNNGDTDDPDLEDVQQYQFVATVLEMDEDSLLVEPAEGEDMRDTADRVTLPTDGLSEERLSEIEVGDEIRIFYTGEVMESYPAQLADVDMIELMDE